MTVYEHADGPPAWRRVRPGKATTAGILLIVPSAIGLLLWSVLVLLALAAGRALADGGGSGGLHLEPRFYLVTVLPVSFWIAAIVVGVLVLRGTPWVRAPAVVMATLAALAGMAGAALVFGLVDGLSVQYLVIGLPYVAVNIRLVYLLKSAELGAWCGRA